MNVAFFTEAGTKRGMGHLVRCYTIAQKFKDNFCKVDFFLDSDIDFSYKFNDLKSFTWDNFELQKKYDVIFIDSYEATLTIYQEASNNSKIAIFLDDENRLNYPKGVIINFAPDANEKFFSKKDENKSYLLGLDYIPIREEFLLIHKEQKENLFIILGGMDTANLSKEIIKSIEDIDIAKTIVTNNLETKNDLEKIENLKVMYRPNDDELINNMASCSLAISTASMSLYELAYLQIPTLSISINQNQEIGSQQLMKHTIVKANICIKDKNWKTRLHQELQEFIQIKNSFKVNNQIDGLGTQRIFDFISRLVV